MNNQTTELLKQLSTKLGTTSEYLWGILLKQAYVSAWVSIFVLLLLILSFYLMFKLNAKFSEKKETKYGLENAYGESDELGLIMMVASFALIVMSIIALCYLIPNIFNGFLNPEYWALNEVLETLKGE